MKKTSVYLEPEVDRALSLIAKQEGISKAAVIREALRRRADGSRRPRFTAIGVGEGPGDVSDNVDKYLTDGFGRD